MMMMMMMMKSTQVFDEKTRQYSRRLSFRDIEMPS